MEMHQSLFYCNENRNYWYKTLQAGGLCLILEQFFRRYINKPMIDTIWVLIIDDEPIW